MTETVVSQDTDTELVVDPRDLHFELSFLGEPHLTSDYTLRWAGRSYPLDRHTPQTLRRAGLEGATPPTHVARDVRSTAGVVGLLQVLGPPDATGFPTLALLAVGAPEKTSFTSADIAQAVVFLNPSVTVLTPGTADTVLQHIAGSDALPGMTFAIETAQSTWNVPRPVVDADGRPVRKPDGTQYHTYELDPAVENSAVPVSGQATSAIYSDDTLSGDALEPAAGRRPPRHDERVRLPQSRRSQRLRLPHQPRRRWAELRRLGRRERSERRLRARPHGHQQLRPPSLGLRQLPRGGRPDRHGGGRQHLDAADEGGDAADRRSLVERSVSTPGRRGAAQDAREPRQHPEVLRHRRGRRHLPRASRSPRQRRTSPSRCPATLRSARSGCWWAASAPAQGSTGIPRRRGWVCR